MLWESELHLNALSVDTESMNRWHPFTVKVDNGDSVLTATNHYEIVYLYSKICKYVFPLIEPCVNSTFYAS